MNPSYESPWASDDVRIFRKTIRHFIQEELTPRQARWREEQSGELADGQLADGQLPERHLDAQCAGRQR